MFRGLLFRTTFMELVRVFLLALTGISLVVLLGILAETLSKFDLTLAQCGKLIPILLPVMTPRTVPTALLFACCVVYGRLARDGEVLAIKMAGIRPLWLLWPAILLGAILSAGMMALYGGPIPRLEHRLATLKIEEALARPADMLCATLRTQSHLSLPELGYTITVRRVHGRTLICPTITQFGETTDSTTIVNAEIGVVEMDPERECLRIHLRGGEMLLESGTIVQIQTHTIDVALPSSLKGKLPRHGPHLEWEELLELRRTFAAEEERLAESGGCQEKLGLLRRQLSALDLQIQGRPAVSFAPFLFVLIGCPLGLRFSCDNYLRAFLLCFLPIVLVYYPLLYGGCRLGFRGTVCPILAVWTANLTLLAPTPLLLRWLR